MQNRRVANEAKWTSGIDTGRIIANEIILVFIPIVVLAHFVHIFSKGQLILLNIR